MRGIITTIGLAALLLGVGLTAWAQEPPPPPEAPALRVTPRQAAQMALTNSLDLQVDAQDVAQAYAKLRQAYAAGNLQLGLQLDYVRMGPIPNLGGISFGSPETTTATLSASQPLYTGGRVQWQARAARAGIDLAKYKTEVTRLALARAAEETAYGVLRAMQLRGVAEELVRSRQEHLRIAQVMFEAGTSPRFEVVQAQTELSSAQGQLVAAQSGVELATAGLRLILVVPQTTALEVAEGAAEPAVEGTLPTLIDQAASARPEVSLSAMAVKTAQAGVGIARASNNLSVSLAGSLAHAKTTSSLSEANSWTAAASAQLPLWDGGMERALVADATTRVLAAQAQEESARQQVALDVTQQFVAVDQATKQLAVAQQGVVEADERLRIAQVRFTAGVTPGLEVIDSQTALASARADLINAQYNLAVATMKLRNALALMPTQEEQS